MNPSTKITVGLLALAASAWMLTAQDATQPPRDTPRPPHRQGPPGPGGPGHHPPPPIIGVLDANHDGVIDAEEIANAPKALLKLDANGDGKLTRDELQPPPPPEDDAGAPGPGPGQPGN